MKQFTIILIILLILGAVAFYFFDKKKKMLDKEKEIFGGMTKKEALVVLRKKWKQKWFASARIYYSDKDNGNYHMIWTKAMANGVSFEEQLVGDLQWMWEADPMQHHPYVKEELDLPIALWKKHWTLSNVEDLGMDTRLPEVQKMMFEI